MLPAEADASNYMLCKHHITLLNNALHSKALQKKCFANIVTLSAHVATRIDVLRDARGDTHIHIVSDGALASDCLENLLPAALIWQRDVD